MDPERDDQEIDDVIEECDLPPMLPGESRSGWVDRIQGLFTRARGEASAARISAEPYDPDEWEDVRSPYRESE